MKQKPFQESKVPFTELFVSIDDFYQKFEPSFKKMCLSDGKRKRRRCSSLKMSEMMTILVGFQLSGYRTFKAYYFHLLAYHRNDFPDLISYQRFIEWIPRLLTPLLCYLDQLRAPCSGISFIDSTPLSVCHPKRINRNQVFKGIAQRGKSSMGWFFGFKLHLIINERGGIVSFCITPGNTDDRKPVEQMAQRCFGKLFGDKGYISKELFSKLFAKGTTLFTHIRSNMKNQLLGLHDRILLRKRSLIETVNDQLKNICQIEHSRHRSPSNLSSG